MQAVEVGKTTINGREFTFAVRHQMFETELDGEILTSASWSGLVNTVASASRKTAVKISVLFSRLEPASLITDAIVRDGAVTGVHGGNGNLLVRWSDGSREQLASYSAVIACRPLSPEEGRKLVSLDNARRDAVHEVRAFLDARAIDLRQAAGRAVRKAEQA